jgi:hypothetical protein
MTVHTTEPFPQATRACGFPITSTEDGSFKIRSYFNNDGVLEKTILTDFQGHFTVTATNPANGKTATTQAESQVVITYYNPDGSIASESQTGVTFNFTVPGLGSILQATGRLVFENGQLVFEAGPHDFRDQNTAAFCAYMADP